MVLISSKSFFIDYYFVNGKSNYVLGNLMIQNLTIASNDSSQSFYVHK